MNKTKIEWTESTWNPVTGCTPVSEGCANCYARRMAHRLAGRYGYPESPHEFDVTLHPERLDQPLRWKKPRMIFVCSMSDLFHEDVPFEFIDDVFAVAALCPQHTFQILTKRPERMLEYFSDSPAPNNIAARAADRYEDGDIVYDEIMARFKAGPLPNAWLGASASTQPELVKNVEYLLQCPAAVRFVSLEPMLGPVDIGMSTATCSCCRRWPSRWVRLNRTVVPDIPGTAAEMVARRGIYLATSNRHGALAVITPAGELGIKPHEFDCLPKLDWVIVGGETGPGARPMSPAWARSVRDQCQAAGVPFFFKQWGAWVPVPPIEMRATAKQGFVCHDCGMSGNLTEEALGTHRETGCNGGTMATYRVGKKAAGRLLDGREWNEMPERS